MNSVIIKVYKGKKWSVMKLKHETSNPSNTNKNSKIFSLLSLIAMSAHILYMIFFFSCKINFMGFVNIFSVSFYIFGFFYLRRGGSIYRFMIMTMFEVYIHAILATLFTGWDYGFQLIVVCLIPVPYMLTLKREKMVYLYSAMNITSFAVLRIVSCNVGVILTDIKIKSDPSILYIYNSISSFLIIIFITSYFKISNQKLNKKLHEQNLELKRVASVDALTGLYNRYAMNEFIEQIEKKGEEYCVAIMDIDFFKKVNDTYGHSAGDMVLIEVAKILQSCVPENGFVCRWGGEEMLMLFPKLSLKDGIGMVEKTRKQIERTNFLWKDKHFSVTATFGVCYTKGGESLDKTIKKADDSLYKGKDSGRNCVVGAA